MVATLIGASMLLASYAPDPKQCQVVWLDAYGVYHQSQDWMTRKTAELWVDFETRRKPDHFYTFRCRPQLYA